MDRSNVKAVVLIVEDDEAIRNLACQILELEGYRVVLSSDARGAFAILQQKAGMVNLVITDVVLPEVNGVELAKRVRDQYPHIAVLLMSGYLEEILTRYGADACGFKLLVKPFTVEQLRREVRECLVKSTSAA